MMMKKSPFVFPLPILALGLTIALIACQTGVEPSQGPGILRITLQSNPADTSIVIVADTFYVSEKDSFGITIFQGKAYNDSKYAVLYPNLNSYKQEDRIYNIIKRENGQYKKYVIFESYVPLEDYEMIQFGMKATVLKINNFDEIKVEAPENANLLIDLQQNFHITENKVTEINVQINPFQSIKRYRDKYQFIPRVEITSVKYY